MAKFIARLLYRRTENRPCRLIHRGQGERYLERYWLGRWRGVTAYLHRFVARDADEWVHDHPWGWSLAIVLTGGYLEERLTWFDPQHGWRKRFRWVRAGRLNLIRARDFHRILEAHPETWTLFIHGPRVKGWGFLFKAENRDLVHYHQPYDTRANANWERTALPGREADRAVLEGSTHG